MRPSASSWRASRLIDRATWSDHLQGRVGGPCEPQEQQKKCGEQVRCLPSGAHPKHLPQDQAQIEGGGVNQGAFGDVALLPQMNSSHSAGIVQVGEAPFDQRATPTSAIEANKYRWT